MKKAKLISERIWNADQSWYFERTVQVGVVKLKVKIRRNAYNDQSYARVERWNGEEWKIVVTAPITECQCQSLSYVTRGVNLADFEKDYTRLLTEAVKIVS